MAQKILQINFNFNLTRDEYETTVKPMAQDFANVPGCLWKIWLMNENESEGGGIYLFADEAAAEAFKNGPLAAAVMSHPALTNINIKEFEVLDEVSRITRAPLDTKTAAA